MQQLRKGNRQRANLGVSFLQHIYVSGVRGQRYGYVSPLFFTRKAVQLNKKQLKTKRANFYVRPFLINDYLFLPRKNSANVPGPLCAPITGSM